ncbi:MAG TPA: hypothetical protein VIO64_22215 [Pseudobacteroides sp.]|uniref:hypothetical protein n=1 Tax=Pseudobacteroides sp. TaxID=1968840 RepID=UPI002F932F8D
MTADKVDKNDKADDGYPLPIKNNWKGLGAFSEGFLSIDAAFSIVDIQGNIKIYFFKGDQYIRYYYLGDISLTSAPDWDITYSQVRRDMMASDSMDSGYPLCISENWHGLVND